MDIARGYFVPGAVVTSRSYNGQVNNGDITIPIKTTNLGHQVHWDNDDWNLVGNPYPSGLDATAFLAENATTNARIEGAIYFWDAGDTTGGYNQHSDYATYNLLGGVPSGNSTKTPVGHVASGQGFWVYAKANTNLVFNNSMRSSTNNQYFKTNGKPDNHLAWIDVVTPNNFKNNILVGYNSTTTDQVDNAYDAHKLEGSANVRFASLIGNDEFAIQGFKALGTGESKTIPLVLFTADSGLHTFSNYQIENLPTHIKIYFKDNTLGLIQELSQNSYTVVLDGNMEYSGRFELVFENTLDIASGGQGSKGSGNDPGADTSSTVTSIPHTYANEFKLLNTTEGYILKREDGIEGTINIMDISGKLIWTKSSLNKVNQVHIKLNDISSGIYFIEVLNQNERLYSNKILVH